MNRKISQWLAVAVPHDGRLRHIHILKDTDEDFKNEILADQANLRAELLKLIEEKQMQVS